MPSLANKVAIVTGGGGGIGSAVALLFAQEGARITVADIDPEASACVAREIAATPGEAFPCAVDVTRKESVHQMMREALDRWGRIDILANVAGGAIRTPVLEMEESEWDEIVGLNLKSVFLCSQAVLPAMIKQRYGKIVNMSSAAGTGAAPFGGGGSPAGNCNYAAAKAGVILLTKTLARELGPHGINVNCIAPGFVVTPMSYTTRSQQEIEKHIESRKKSTVLNRAGTLEDIANVVLFLVSDESSFISGQLLCVDGGRTDRM